MYEISPTELSAVKSNEIDYFEENIQSYSEQEKDNILNAALVNGKIPTIKFFLEHGAKVVNNASLINLMKLKKKAAFLQYLESKGVELQKKGNILLFHASLANNEPFVSYLANKILELDHRSVAISIINLIGKYKDNLLIAENTFDTLMLKLSPAKAQEIFKDVNFYGATKEINEAFIQKKILAHSISHSSLSAPINSIKI